MTRRHALTALLVTTSLLLAACGGDGEQKQASAIDGDPSTTIPAALTNLDPPKPRDPNKPLPVTNAVKNVSTDLKVKPVLGKPSGAAPKELQGLDVVTGKGPIAKAGDTVQMQYVGVTFKDGKEFDTSFKGAGGKPGEPLEVTLGQGGVIKGWDEGIPGMKAGGRRILVIPPDLAYGSTGSPPNIGPDETLVFAVDLVKIG
ncbi:MAG TPA: FKBP-type peptidyl-prolyl cis-trans isomerase [Baekduia sp.]|nr:FKBP-type peptidyl-prolyl cis-trans isomerase [Baekduia sp.]